MLGVGSFTVLFSSIFILTDTVNMYFNKDPHVIPCNSTKLSSLNGKITTDMLDNCRKLRNTSHFGQRLCYLLICYKFKGDLKKAGEITYMLYKIEMDLNKSRAEAVDFYYFNSLGTNESAEYFYDNLEISLGIKIRKGIVSMLPWFALSNIFCEYRNTIFLYFKFLLNVLVHYSDVVKDIVLLRQIWNYMLGNSVGTLLEFEFPSVVFWVILTSVAGNEMSILITFICSAEFNKYSKLRKVLSILLAPCIPGVIHYQELKHEHCLKQLVCATERLNDVMSEDWIDSNFTRIRKRINVLRSLRADIRATETVLEHFSQLVILLLILTLTNTNTAKVVRMDKIFNNNELLIFVSTAWSFISLLRGLVSYVKASKSNYLPLLGQLVLFTYFAVSMSVRLLSIVLFFTPHIGLFDTNYHSILGVLSPNTFVSRDTDQDLQRMFDNGENGTATYFDVEWQKVQIKEPKLFYFPSFFRLFFISLVILHIILTLFLQTKLYRDHTTKRIVQALNTMLCPPLFLDWEVIYRACKGSITIKESWRRSHKLIITHIMIHFIEHVALCIPLILFKRRIDKRNEQLDELFPPLKDELYSTYIVNVLIGLGLASSFILPPIQYGLARLYFIKGHPWSRLLNAKL
jgi:hypothetical protein